MKAVKVTFDNGDIITTKINGTEAEIKSYYLGKIFNVGILEDCLARAVNVEIIDGAPVNRLD